MLSARLMRVHCQQTGSRANVQHTDVWLRSHSSGDSRPIGRVALAIVQHAKVPTFDQLVAHVVQVAGGPQTSQVRRRIVCSCRFGRGYGRRLLMLDVLQLEQAFEAGVCSDRTISAATQKKNIYWYIYCI